MKRIGILVFLVFSNAVCRRSDDATFISTNMKLYFDLFENYYAHMSPYNTGSQHAKDDPPAEVHISLEYSHLTNVIEVQMTHVNVFGLQIIWRDPRLVWDPAQYANISYIYVKTTDIWMPEISACESSTFSLIVPERMQKVKINATGHLDFFMFGYASYICDFNMRDFPFDKHWCFYCFALPSYDDTELVFKGINGTTDVVLDTSEWGVQMRGSRHQSIKEKGLLKENLGAIYFDFLITRRPTFWVLLIIIPTYLLGFLILLGLFFGSDANNANAAVNFGLVTFTSMTFIIGIIAGTLPKSQNVSILGWYIFFQLMLITFAVLSVFFHETVCNAAKSSYKWYTGESIRKITPEEMNDEQRRESIVETTANRLLKFIVERVLERGRANFSVFFGLHTLNLAWLLSYAYADAPELPSDYFIRKAGSW